MAHRAGIESQRVRNAVVAVVMLVCLLASLAMANLLVRSRQVTMAKHRIGDLELKLPDTFEAFAFDRPIIHADVLASFRDAKTDHRLVVAQLHGRTPQSPMAALQSAALMIRQLRSLAQKTTAFRQGATVGQKMIAIAGPTGSEQLHLLAVLTDDARRYRIIWLSRPLLQTGSTAEADEVLHNAICDSVVNQDWRRPSDTELAQAGLDAQWLAKFARDQGIEAVVPAEQTPDQPAAPLTLLATDGPAGLGMMRLLLTYDTTSADPAQLPPPLNVLVGEFTYATNRRPQKSELTTVRIGQIDAWRARFAAQGNTMARSIWYVPFAGGRAALIEVSGDGTNTQQRVTRWLKPLIDAISTNLSQAKPTSSVAVEHAMDRGNELAAHMRQQFDAKTQPGWSYQLYQYGDNVIACGLRQVQQRQTGQPLPVRGWMKDLWFTGPMVEFNYQWFAAANLNAMKIEQRRLIGKSNNEPVYDLRQMVMAGGKLQLSRRVGKNAEQSPQVVAAPAAFIPPMAEIDWPIEPLRQMRGQSAIMWFSRGIREPTPYWVRVHGEPQGPVVLYLRPMMSIDSDRLVLDDAGRVSHERRYAGEGQLLGPGSVSVLHVDRQTWLRSIPTNVTQLIKPLFGKSQSNE